MDLMDELGLGVQRFRSHVFPSRRSLFQRLAAAQEPKALFLTCVPTAVSCSR